MKKQLISTRFTSSIQGPEKVDYKVAVAKWFLSLPVEERAMVLAVEDLECVKLIRYMYKLKCAQGEGLFFRDEDDYSSSTNNVFFRKLTNLSHHCFYPESLVEKDKMIENAIRLCDTQTYLDTICVSRQFLENGKRFLQLMDVASRGGFLTVPCRVAWNTSTKQWVWTTPTWFEGMGYFSLGTFIAHKLEQVIWMRYWEATKNDPRVKVTPNTSPKQTKQTRSISMRPYNVASDSQQRRALLSKVHLFQFWHSRSLEERRRIVPRLGNIVEHVLMSDDVDESIKGTPRKVNKNNLDYSKLLSSLVDISTDKTTAVFFKNNDFLISHEELFIEMLYFSPLATAGTQLDMILRRIGLCIQGGYIEKVAMDLILGEETEKIKKAAIQAKRKKSKKKKRKGSFNSQQKKAEVVKAQPSPKKEEPEKKVRVSTKDKSIIIPSRSEAIRNTVSIIIDELITNVEMAIAEKEQQAAKAEQLKRKQRNKETKLKLQQQQQLQLQSSPTKHSNQHNNYHRTRQNITAPLTAHNHGHTQSCGALMTSSQKPPLQPKSELENSLNLIMPSDKDSKYYQPDYKLATLGLQNGWAAIPKRRTASQPAIVSSPLITPLHSPREGLDHNKTFSSLRSSMEIIGRHNTDLVRDYERVPYLNGVTRFIDLSSPEDKQNEINSESPVITIPTPTSQHCIEIQPQSKPPFPTPYKPPTSSIANRLDKEIVEYVAYIRRVAEEFTFAAADTMRERVRVCVNKLWPNAKVELYGSFGTRLCIPSSDLDLVILGATPPCQGVSAFELLKNELEKQDWIEYFQAIDTAKVPVIKITSRTERIPTDITFANDTNYWNRSLTPSANTSTVNHSGLASVELILQYKARLPTLEPLVLILKQFLHERGLNNAFTGGLSSYCLVLMVISFIELFGYTEQKEPKNCGALLLEFFEYYGKHFDYQTTGITIGLNGGGKLHFPLDNHYHKFGAASLVILDPFNPSRNVAYSTFSMWRVKCAFEYGYAALTNTMSNARQPTLLSCILLHAQPKTTGKGYRPHYSTSAIVSKQERRVVDDNEVYENRRKERHIQNQQPLQAIYQNGTYYHD